jgi:hypothetical protein
MVGRKLSDGDGECGADYNGGNLSRGNDLLSIHILLWYS